MSMLPIVDKKVYDDGRTKQSFKDSTDINKILKKAQLAGTVSHLVAHGGEYGDFSNFDFFEAQNLLARAKTIFEELPSEVRKDFEHDPSKFFAFVNDPENADKLSELLPEIAEPGRYFPSVVRTAVSEALQEALGVGNENHSQPDPGAGGDQGGSEGEPAPTDAPGGEAASSST